MKNRIPLVIIVFLVIGIAVLSFFNQKDLAKKKRLDEEEIFSIWENGESLKAYSKDELKRLGDSSFTANLKASGKEAESHEYRGLPLVVVLEDAGLNILKNRPLTVSAIDGYAVAIPFEKWSDPENVYLAYEMDGQPLGNKANGGVGPYQVIISKDKFSQFWCKYAFKAEFNE